MTVEFGPSTGRREQKKHDTRVALQRAAAQLFAEHGYEATTVAHITAAAGVGERTFYRYFDSKDDLLADQALSWIDDLHDAIRNRPAQENAYLAVARAMTTLAGQMLADRGSGGYWLMVERRQPVALLRRATPRPGRRLEQSIADAVLPRLQAKSSDAEQLPKAPDPRLQAQLLARVAVAVLRTAAIAHRELVRDGASSPGIEQLLQDAFAQLTTIVRPA
jgi:AcrR family transcriptional regulator